MKELNALIYIVFANVTIGLFHPLSATVGDVTITAQWGYSALEIELTDGYESFTTSSVKDAKKALRNALNNPRPARDEYPTRAFC